VQKSPEFLEFPGWKPLFDSSVGSTRRRPHHSSRIPDKMDALHMESAQAMKKDPSMPGPAGAFRRVYDDFASRDDRKGMEDPSPNLTVLLHGFGAKAHLRRELPGSKLQEFPVGETGDRTCKDLAPDRACPVLKAAGTGPPLTHIPEEAGNLSGSEDPGMVPQKEIQERRSTAAVSRNVEDSR